METVVESLLEERNSDMDIKCTDATTNPSFKDTSFSVYNLKKEIKSHKGNKLKNDDVKLELSEKDVAILDRVLCELEVAGIDSYEGFFMDYPKSDEIFRKLKNKIAKFAEQSDINWRVENE